MKSGDFEEFYPFAVGYVRRRLSVSLYRKERDDIRQIIAVAVLEAIRKRNKAESGQFAIFCGMRAYGAVWDNYHKRKLNRLFRQWSSDIDEPGSRNDDIEQIDRQDELSHLLGSLPHERKRMVETVYKVEQEREATAKQFGISKNHLNKHIFNALQEIRDRHNIAWKSRIKSDRKPPLSSPTQTARH